MNAYELADELKRCIDDGSTDLVCVCGAVNMLRQQADLIAEFEKFLNETCQTGTFIVWRDSQELAKYQQQAAQLWNDSCTSNRSTK